MFFVVFDIMFLMVFLRNICNLKFLVIGWGNLLFEEDKGFEVDIVCIKYFRNIVYVFVV